MVEHFRGVVWPRERVDDGRLYRYTIVGLLVTDKPLDGIEGKNEVVLDGSSFTLLSEALVSIKQVEPAIRIGDANMILTSLNEIVGKDDE